MTMMAWMELGLVNYEGKDKRDRFFRHNPWVERLSTHPGNYEVRLTGGFGEQVIIRGTPERLKYVCQQIIEKIDDHEAAR